MASIELSQYKSFETDSVSKNVDEYFGNFATQPHICGLIRKIMKFNDDQFKIGNVKNSGPYEPTFTISHSNSITEQDTLKLGKIKFDSAGHITGFEEITDFTTTPTTPTTSNQNLTIKFDNSDSITYNGSESKEVAFTTQRVNSILNKLALIEEDINDTDNFLIKFNSAEYGQTPFKCMVASNLWRYIKNKFTNTDNVIAVEGENIAVPGTPSVTTLINKDSQLTFMFDHLKGEKGTDGAKWLTGTFVAKNNLTINYKFTLGQTEPSHNSNIDDLYLNTNTGDVFKVESTTLSNVNYKYVCNIKGADGTKWLTGAVISKDNLTLEYAIEPGQTNPIDGVNIGDLYLNKDTGDVFTINSHTLGKINYEYVFNIKGAAGKDGNIWKTGTKVSKDNLIINYINEHEITGPNNVTKANNEPVVTGTTGPVTGVTGTTGVISGDLIYKNTDNIGDLYLNTETYDVFQVKSVNMVSTTYEYVCNIKGTDGKDGTDGTKWKTGTEVTKIKLTVSYRIQLNDETTIKSSEINVVTETEETIKPWTNPDNIDDLYLNTDTGDVFKAVFIAPYATTYEYVCNISGGSNNLGSDIRFKKNIQNINKGILEKLMKLDIISYKWCKQGEVERNTFGVKANQLVEFGGLFKKIVHEHQDEDKTQWVEYDRLGVLAIAGLKEIERARKSDKRYLLKKINDQQTIIENLQRDLSLMQKKQKNLENRLNKIEIIAKKLM